MSGRVRVSVVATGIDTPKAAEAARPRLVAVGGGAPMAQPASVAVGSAQVSMVAGVSAVGAPAAVGHPAPHPFPAVALRPSGGQPATGQVPGHVPAGHQAPVMEAPIVDHAPPAPTMQPMARLSTPSLPGRPAPAARSGLFADPAARDAQPPAAAPAEPPRPSLFGTVTGLMRRRASAAQAYEAETAERAPVAEPQQPEPARPSVRAVAGEEMGIEIPTFLRRQSS
jgi:cell division protein FtsZ